MRGVRGDRGSVIGLRRGLSGGMCLVGMLVCGSASPQPAAKSAADYWPFRLGNTWTLEVTVDESKMTQVITVTKVTKTGGKTRAELEYKTDGRTIQREIYDVDAGSLSRAAAGPAGTGNLTPPLPVIRFPFTKGKKWSWKGNIAVNSSVFNATTKMSESGPETVKSAAGTFSAIRVHMDLDMEAGPQHIKIANDYWFAPHVGLVKQKAVIGGRVIEGIVTSYKLVK